MQHQATVIDELIKLNSALSARVQHVEAQLAAAPGSTTAQAQPVIASEAVPQQASSGMRRRGATTNLADAWYAWFAGSAQNACPVDRRMKSTIGQLVAYMRLFIGGYALDRSAPDFRDAVIHYGTAASANVEAFLTTHQINARATGTALKALRSLHRAGQLDELIVSYRQRLLAGKITDPSSPASLNTLELASPSRALTSTSA
jgi:hypothetical protein